VRALNACAVLALAFGLAGAADPVADSLRADPRAASVFAQALAARDAAQAADAYLYSPEEWQRAEKALAGAASDFDRGTPASAAGRADEIELLYRAAERAAFGASLLVEPRATLAEARKSRAGRYAPITMTHAETLMSQSYQALVANPPDRERAMRLAAEATAEARHALALGALLEEKSAEEAVLAYQDALATAAKSAGTELSPDATAAETASVLQAAIERERAERTQLENDLEDRNDQILRLQEELSSITSQLDGVARERLDLAQQLDTQAAARERMTQVEQMFTASEAEVLSERDDIVIRLFGLQFAPGSSKLGRGQDALLAKVVEAIALYRERDLVVEGHTDAAGSADANLELSRARARSVRDYFIESGRVLPARVSSEGYGETLPVASNDTEEGRARNRRIDIRLRASALP
jgi:outer membrane protein OmpA-like peptidoglycan-associated protein